MSNAQMRRLDRLELDGRKDGGITLVRRYRGETEEEAIEAAKVPEGERLIVLRYFTLTREKANELKQLGGFYGA